MEMHPPRVTAKQSADRPIAISSVDRRSAGDIVPVYQKPCPLEIIKLYKTQIKAAAMGYHLEKNIP
jgi:hypothetical protein